MGEIRIVGPGKIRGIPIRCVRKFCLAHGLRQLTRDAKSDVMSVVYKRHLRAIPKNSK